MSLLHPTKPIIMGWANEPPSPVPSYVETTLEHWKGEQTYIADLESYARIIDIHLYYHLCDCHQKDQLEGRNNWRGYDYHYIDCPYLLTTYWRVHSRWTPMMMRLDP